MSRVALLRHSQIPVYVALASVADLDKAMAPFGPSLGPPVVFWDEQTALNGAHGRHRYRLREGRKECIKHDGDELALLNDHLPYQITKVGDHYEARHQLQFQTRWLKYQIVQDPQRVRLVTKDGATTGLTKVSNLDLEATQDPEAALTRGIWQGRPAYQKYHHDKHWSRIWKGLIGSAPPSYYVIHLEIAD